MSCLVWAAVNSVDSAIDARTGKKYPPGDMDIVHLLGLIEIPARHPDMMRQPPVELCR
ncbi:hypothetical protein OG413_42705 [Streptomyces sp. NBC_01433]|uniref:hypothetical protein n=1 Tax=Streptomyces sp. NBC_01433 TaxID=2903864 RepID=UPI00225BBC0D|nr:hypothetical protein [Streptomyces sp. NBC_01433]MCX4681913.1 hypothetical protein [Streptomyces sp. NBC_01433]